MRIGIWGPSSAGKSTYIASISHATMEGGIGWTLQASRTRAISQNTQDGSKATLEEWRRAFQVREFPPPTVVRPAHPYMWEMSSAATEETRTNGRAAQVVTGWIRRMAGEPTIPNVTQDGSRTFELTFYDQPGELFAGISEAAQTADRVEIMEFFSGCDGLLFLYDPLKPEDNYNCFLPVVTELPKTGGKLPQSVAVCLSRLDDPRVFEKLDSPKFPEEFKRFSFDEVSSSVGGARHIVNLLGDVDGFGKRFLEGVGNYFQMQRVGFYLTSSIGFKRGAGGIDWNDYANARLKEVGPEERMDTSDSDFSPQTPGSGQESLEPETIWTSAINGIINPHNVLEPLVWMYEHTRQGQV